MAEHVAAERVRGLLAYGEIDVLGLLPNASNYTFAATVTDDDLRAVAVYKPRAGERPLWDFPDGTLYRREVAAYVVSEALGWGFVPPTVVRDDAPHGVGSMQLFIDADPEEHYLSLMPARADVFRRVAAFDICINNADRKSSHCLLERETSRVWLVDHGVSFHAEEKLRTFIWEFAGESLPAEVIAALARAPEVAPLLDGLLEAEEIAAFVARADALRALGHFPDPPEDRRPYPWPPI